jgi:hypothetical protein
MGWVVKGGKKKEVVSRRKKREQRRGKKRGGEQRRREEDRGQGLWRGDGGRGGNGWMVKEVRNGMRVRMDGVGDVYPV